MSTEEKGTIIVNALAEYWDCEPEDIRGYVIGAERVTNDGEMVSFSSIWSAVWPVWTLLGFCEELRKHIQKQAEPEPEPTNGVAQLPRAARRGRGTRR